MEEVINVDTLDDWWVTCANLHKLTIYRHTTFPRRLCKKGLGITFTYHKQWYFKFTKITFFILLYRKNLNIKWKISYLAFKRHLYFKQLSKDIQLKKNWADLIKKINCLKIFRHNKLENLLFNSVQWNFFKLKYFWNVIKYDSRRVLTD
jgi:hypothetical protein